MNALAALCRGHASRVAGMLLTMLCTCGPAGAADNCQPRRNLEAGTFLKFLGTEQTLTPRLEATLAQDLTLKVLPARFGLGSTKTSTVLQQAVPVSGHLLGRGVIVDDAGDLMFDMEDGVAWLYAADRRYTVRVRGGKARDVGGVPLVVMPVLIRDVPFEVGAQAAVRAAGDAQVVIAKGSKLIWRANPSQPLEAALVRPARLQQTAQDAGTNALWVTPSRVAPGGKVQVQINVEGLDLRKSEPTVCFAAPVVSDAGSELRVVSAESVKFVGQSGDKATFEVQMPIPQKPEHSLSEGSAWWQRVIGLPVELWVFVYNDKTLVLDLRARRTLTSYIWSIVSGLVVLLALYVLTAALKNKWQPFSLVGELIRHPSGRYSLSNLQILMWTLLVIFALCLAWISSGVLLPLSPGVLALLGISAGSSVLARGVEKKTEAPSTSGLTPNTEGQPTTGVIPKARDLVSDDDSGGIDLLRVQMLGFTLFTWTYALVSVLRNEGLPEIPNDLLLLMGISNVAYLGGKASKLLGPSESTPPATSTVPTDGAPTVATDFEKTLTRQRIEPLQKALSVAATGVLDQPTREAVAEFKRAQGIYPANGRVNEFLLDKVIGRV